MWKIGDKLIIPGLEELTHSPHHLVVEDSLPACSLLGHILGSEGSLYYFHKSQCFSYPKKHK